ncbi:MAG: hypothetical protein ACOCV2_03020 [Persicimonas sp.]
MMTVPTHRRTGLIAVFAAALTGGLLGAVWFDDVSLAAQQKEAASDDLTEATESADHLTMSLIDDGYIEFPRIPEEAAGDLTPLDEYEADLRIAVADEGIRIDNVPFVKSVDPDKVREEYDDLSSLMESHNVTQSEIEEANTKALSLSEFSYAVSDTVRGYHAASDVLKGEDDPEPPKTIFFVDSEVDYELLGAVLAEFETRGPQTFAIAVRTGDQEVALEIDNTKENRYGLDGEDCEEVTVQPADDGIYAGKKQIEADTSPIGRSTHVMEVDDRCPAVSEDDSETKITDVFEEVDPPCPDFVLTAERHIEWADIAPLIVRLEDRAKGDAKLRAPDLLHLGDNTDVCEKAKNPEAQQPRNQGMMGMGASDLEQLEKEKDEDSDENDDEAEESDESDESGDSDDSDDSDKIDPEVRDDFKKAFGGGDKGKEDEDETPDYETTIERVEVGQSCDPQEVEDAVDRRRASFEACPRTAANSGPVKGRVKMRVDGDESESEAEVERPEVPEGKAEVTWKIHDDGRITEPDVVDSSLDSGAAHRCLSDAATRIRGVASDGEACRVRYRVEYELEE